MVSKIKKIKQKQKQRQHQNVIVNVNNPSSVKRPRRTTAPRTKIIHAPPQYIYTNAPSDYRPTINNILPQSFQDVPNQINMALPVLERGAVIAPAVIPTTTLQNNNATITPLTPTTTSIRPSDLMAELASRVKSPYGLGLKQTFSENNPMYENKIPGTGYSNQVPGTVAIKVSERLEESKLALAERRRQQKQQQQQALFDKALQQKALIEKAQLEAQQKAQFEKAMKDDEAIERRREQQRKNSQNYRDRQKGLNQKMGPG